MPALPFKLNQAGRHHLPGQKHKVTNWPAYDASLRQRGSLTVWFTDEAIQAWGGRTPHDPGRTALVLAPGDPDSPHPPGRVPLGAAPNRGPDRLHHPPARPRSCRAGSHNPEPPGSDAGGAPATVGQHRGWVRCRARAFARGQHRAEAVWARRVAAGETWHQDATVLEETSHRHGCRHWPDRRLEVDRPRR